MTRGRWYLAAVLCIVGMTVLNLCGIQYGDSVMRWAPFSGRGDLGDAGRHRQDRLRRAQGVARPLRHAEPPAPKRVAGGGRRCSPGGGERSARGRDARRLVGVWG